MSSSLIVVGALLLATSGFGWLGMRLISVEPDAETQDAFYEEAPSRSRSRPVTMYRLPNILSEQSPSLHDQS